MTESVYFFSELKNRDQLWAGGKGRTLARLYQKGYQIPNGFLIMPSAFQGDEVLSQTWTRVRANLEQMRGVMTEIAFAVRSSALGEDSISASFAGQYKTILAVRTDEEVRQAVEAVRRSRHSIEVQAYCAALGMEIPPDMAVVVQQMVPAEISGVLFTADPLTGSRSKMTGNFTFGLGEIMVSGRITPHTFTLQQAGSLSLENSYNGPPALKSWARRLFKLGRCLEKEMGCPQDIEWAVVGRKLYLLQSRPITTLNAFNKATGEFNDSLSGDYLWSNVNFSEAMPQVMTPLSWTVAQHIYESCSNLIPGFKNSGNIGGRPYINLSVLASVFKLMGKREKDILQALESICTRIPKGMEIPTLPLPSWFMAPMVVNFINLSIKWNRAFRKLPEYLTGNPARCDQIRKRIQEAGSRDELNDLWSREIEPHLMQGAWIYVGTCSRLSYANKLHSRLTGLVGVDDADQLISDPGCISPADGEFELLASLGPMLGMARVAGGKIDRAAYMAQCGHRGFNEFELSTPRSAEDPTWFQEQLALLAASPVDAEDLLIRQRDRFTHAWTRLRDSHPYRASFIRSRIKEAALRNHQREAARSEYTRDRWLARAFALRAGQLTGLGDNIFFLTIEELLGVLMGDATAVQYIPMRKEKHSQYMALPVYPPFIRGYFDPLRWAADPSRRFDIYDAGTLASRPQASEECPNHIINGTPVSAGRVEGVVRRLERPEDGEQLQMGEVLVTSLTDIAWTPLFLRAAAIVTDVGAALSHTAIVARELGIPAVVGCGNATVYLHNGDRVRVDGGQGVVEVLE